MNKKYVIMINYGIYEGWAIHEQTDELATAILLKDQAARYGQEVVIVKPVKLVITEETEECLF